MVAFACFHHLGLVLLCVCFVNNLCIKSLNSHGVVFCQKVRFQLVISYDIYVHVCLQDSLGPKCHDGFTPGVAASHGHRLDPSEPMNLRDDLLASSSFWCVLCG